MVRDIATGPAVRASTTKGPRMLMLTLMSTLMLTGCLSATGTGDNSGVYYARLTGTVTRSDGTVVSGAQIGISCVGVTAEPFGFTTEANTLGHFDVNLNAPAAFAPLEGNRYLCRVLTPYVGVAQADKTVSVDFSTVAGSRPVTDVALVIP